jgi:hypothetical protein
MKNLLEKAARAAKTPAKPRLLLPAPASESLPTERPKAPARSERPPLDAHSPLQDILRKAAASKVVGPAAKLKKRMEGATNELVVVCDCSGSMGDYIGHTGQSKYEHLEIALKDILKTHPRIRIIPFASTARVIDAHKQRLPRPSGSTRLDEALKLAKSFKPRKTIIISDGQPDDRKAALTVAESMTGQIDSIYCGPDGDPAIEFLRSLCHGAGGESFTWDGYKAELSSVVQRLLPAAS